LICSLIQPIHHIIFNGVDCMVWSFKVNCFVF
jgi:hypothetical protein